MSLENSPPLTRSGLLVAVASGVSNVLGFVFLAMLSRAYAPGPYGAVSALLGLAAIGSVPSAAVQLLIARQVASGRPRGGIPSGRVVVGLGLGLLAVVMVLAPLLQHLLHIADTAALFWLGMVLVPFTVGGGLQGLLLGSQRFLAFSAGLLLISGSRVVTAVVAMVRHTSVTGTMAVLAVGTVAAVAVLAVVTREWWWWRAPVGTSLGAQTRAFLAILSALSAFTVLSGLDLLLARHFLDAATSGMYAVGSLFTKAGLWGPQFVAIVVFPRLAAGAGRPLLLRATAVLCAIGLVGVGLVSLLGPRIVAAASGPAYAEAGQRAWLFACLGGLLALVQLVTMSAVAERSAWASWLIWVAVAAEVGVVSTVGSDSMVAVLLSAMVVTVLLVVVGLAKAARSQVAPRAVSSVGRLDAV